MTGIELVRKLRAEHDLDDASFLRLLDDQSPETLDFLTRSGGEVARSVFGPKIYIRGLIEVSNICTQDCLYCGIRRSNHKADRYRLTDEQILGAAAMGYAEGFRTFVLQGGEDPAFTDAYLTGLIRRIKEEFPDCAITLSLGERSKESYMKLREAGADRYLLRHETATPEHFAALHPASQRLDTRLACLDALTEAGFQAGCGFMLGSPGQSSREILRDLRYVQAFKPHMVGVGPFIPHEDTPLGQYPAGTAEQTIKLYAILRLMDPKLLLPSTTALATIDPRGRLKGILAGANVVMPNLSPPDVRVKYALYRKKAITGAEAAEHLNILRNDLASIGYTIEVGRGDSPLFREEEEKRHV